ncbi:molybdenum cofactor guanylyltransferase MobA [Thalassobaculum sp.]|uniref:molybdenum cofactor guanylyltransferase MobA n=1 Tax=Thalassobaculum sp. TaxID=2022740 RepID=UPI0032EF6435
MATPSFGTLSKDRIVGVLLAGGQARRMGGGDKCLRTLGDRTLLARAIGRLESQVGLMVLNANGDPARFADYSLPVVADPVEGFAGPLAGVLAGLDWAAARAPGAEWIVTVPTDAPAFPTDLVSRLADSLQSDGAELACASSGGRRHPVFGLWPIGLRGALRDALIGRDVRKVDVFTADYQLAVADWPTDPVDPFLNVNRPEELATAERLLAAI